MIPILILLSAASCCSAQKDSKEYYDTGELREEIIYDKIQKANFKVIEYYKSGKVKSKGSYTNGKVYDEGWYDYYDTGELLHEIIYDKSGNGRRKDVTYYKNGKAQAVQNFFKEQEDGENISYYENGTIMFHYYMKDGVKDGRQYSNYKDGKLGYEFFFTNKFKTGTWRYYNEDGTIRQETIFQENKTPWDSDEDYATQKFYFNNKLAYTVELVAGKEASRTVVDKDGYDKLMALEPPLSEQLFKQNCTQCHSIDHDLVGPMLKGVTKKRTDEWLTKMITNGDALVKSGDKDAADLFKKWYNIVHPNFEKLSNEEVKALIEYLKTFK